MEIFYSKSKFIKAFLLALLMSFAAGLLAAELISGLLWEKASVLSTFSAGDIFSILLLIIILFALSISLGAALVFCSRIFNSAPQLIVSLEGINDKRLNLGMIGWNEVTYVILSKDKYTQMLSLTLNEPEKYYHRLPKFELFLRKLNGQRGNNDFRIRFADLDKPIDEIWVFIENKIIKPREEKGIHLMP